MPSTLNALLVILLYYFFDLIVLSSSKPFQTCDIFSNVKRTVLKEGFHRELDYLVEVSYFEQWEDCTLCIEEFISKSFYINTDELEDLSRIGKVAGKVNTSVDIELPYRLAKPHPLLLYSGLVELDNRLAARLSVPFHIRYHGAQFGGGTVRAYFNPPKVFIHCPHLHCPDFVTVLPCQNNSDKCLYKRLPDLLKSDIYVDIPVGNLDDYPLVVTVTFLTTCFGSVYLLYTLSLHSKQ